MAQSTLTQGPGTLVRDALALELLDSTLAAEATTNPNAGDGWVDAQWPVEVAVYAVTGTVTGTGVTCDIAIQAADLADGTGLVTLGKFATLTEASDDVTKVLRISPSGKKFLRAQVVTAGTTPSVPLVVTVRETHDRVTKTTTA